MSPSFFDTVFSGIVAIASYRIFDMYLCRILAFTALPVLLFISRFVSSLYVNAFAGIIALVLYFFPDLVRYFVAG